MLSREPVTRPSPEEFFECVAPFLLYLVTSLTLQRLATSPKVTVLVGEKEESFKYPRDLLGHYSPYFKACFNGNFKEGKESLLRLPEDNPEFFKLLSCFLRDGNVAFSTASPESVAGRIKLCFEFIQFIDKYDLIELMAVVNTFLKPYIVPNKGTDWKNGGPGSVMDLIWVTMKTGDELFDTCLELLPQGDTLLNMIAECCLRYLNESALESDKDKMVIRRLVGRNVNLAAAMMLLLSRPSNYGEDNKRLKGTEKRKITLIMA